MKKNNFPGEKPGRINLLKPLLVMKFITILLIAFCLQSGAAGFSQNRISLKLDNKNIDAILAAVQKQSSYHFLYRNGEDLKRIKKTIDVTNETFENVMQEIFAGTPFSYNIVNEKLVVIVRKDPAHALIAAKRTVSGVVTNESGTPVEGASVLVQGGTAGTTTDKSGSFALEVPDNAVLVISMVGYLSQEIPVRSENYIKVVLRPIDNKLDEIVVIGYGIQKRENVIGSISTLGGDKLQSRTVTQLQNALTGQLPGVTVTQRNGRPGAASGAISIRGVGSFGADPSVLILIDGIPAGGFNDIDPNDVESISVLKDASSAAVYGARAANGVILVTTKSGAKGKVSVTYNGYVGAQVATAIPEFVNSYEYALAYNEGSPSPVFTDVDLKGYLDGNDRDRYPNTNFIDSILKRSALQTGHNITVAGGTENNQYNFSVGYMHQDGLVDKNNYSRYNARLNMVTAISKKLKLTSRMAYTLADVDEPGTGVLSLIDGAVKLPANVVGRYSNGTFGEGLANNGTPISTLASKSFFKNNEGNLNGNLRLDYNITRDLRLSGIGSYVTTDREERTFQATQLLRGDILLSPNKLTEAIAKTKYYTFQALADYNKKIGRHNITALLGYSFEKTTNRRVELSRTNFPSNDKPIISLGSPATQQTDETGFIWAIESQFARVNYNYAGRYLVEGVVRRDGSSRFPPENKYAYFPSVAVGWRISQEKFIKENYPWLSEFKIKASRGVLGNQNISNYPYQNTLGTNINAANTQSSIYSLGGVVVQGVARTQIVDTTLHWESTRTTDVGMEFGLFENKISGSATYFNRYTYDILIKPSASLSTVLGFGVSQQNSGSLRNKGWEFTLNYNDQFGKWGVNVNSNFSIINNEVIDLGVGNVLQPNGMVGNGSELFIGYPIQMYYGYIADGLFVDQSDIDGWAKYSTAITAKSVPGDIRYKDISGPEGIPDGVIDPTYDRVFLGSQIPKYTYGVNLGVRYNSIDFSVLLQGITGVKGNLTGNFGWAFNNGANIQRWQYDGRWTADNPNRYAVYPRVEVMSNAGNANTPLSSFWMLNGSYLRVKNAQIGYTLPQNILSAIHISRARLFFSGENILTLDNYRKGWDPEVNTGANFYPIISNYTFGLNITF